MGRVLQVYLLNKEPPIATAEWLHGSRILFPTCSLSLVKHLSPVGSAEIGQRQDCQRNCLWDTARATSIVEYLKATSLLLVGPLQDSIPFLHFFLTLGPLTSQMVSMSVLAYTSLVFPGSSLPFASTSVCIIVTEQSSHQNRVKTKLERKGEKK